MNQITKLMINEFRIRELGYDFMGYDLKRNENINFHHLIIPRRNCESFGLGDGYFRWNGAIIQSTPHNYLHIVESRDQEMFKYITKEMVDMNVKGYLDRPNLKRIDEVLNQFEREHSGDTTNKGKLLIKEIYTVRHKF